MVSETIRVNYDIHVAMQLELRNLRQRVAAFESGAAYQRMETANHRIRKQCICSKAFLPARGPVPAVRDGKNSCWLESFPAGTSAGPEGIFPRRRVSFPRCPSPSFEGACGTRPFGLLHTKFVKAI